MELNQPTLQTDRRGFFKKALAVVIGGAIGVVPALAGLMVLLDPLRRKAAAGGAVKVTTLDALPSDGVPRKFPVFANRTDAWNKYVNVPVGAVYLRRTSNDNVEALNVVCPHAGCFVDFRPDSSQFVCPCHNSQFAVNGKIATAATPSPRDLDSLQVDVRKDGGVWVVFQNFKAGQKEKVPVA
jgi:menaquinol-cytochrome c reductase iron-sulfur subunit